MCENDVFLQDVEAVMREDMKSKLPMDRKQWLANIKANPRKYEKKTGLPLLAIMDVLLKLKDELDNPLIVETDAVADPN